MIHRFDLGCIGLGATKREEKTKHVIHIAKLGLRYIVFHGFHNVSEAENVRSARTYGLRLGLT